MARLLFLLPLLLLLLRSLLRCYAVAFPLLLPILLRGGEGDSSIQVGGGWPTSLPLLFDVQFFCSISPFCSSVFDVCMIGCVDAAIIQRAICKSVRIVLFLIVTLPSVECTGLSHCDLETEIM